MSKDRNIVAKSEFPTTERSFFTLLVRNFKPTALPRGLSGGGGGTVQ